MVEQETKAVPELQECPETARICQLCWNPQSLPVSLATNDFDLMIRTLIGAEFEIQQACDLCSNKVRDFYEFRAEVIQNLASPVECKVKDEIEVEGHFDDDDVPLSTLKRTPDRKSKRRRTRKIEEEIDEAENDEDDRKIREFYDLSCKECGELFENFTFWKTHMKELHRMPRPYIECCKIQLHARSNLLTHRTLHVNPDAFKCTICGRQCKSLHRLKEHMLSRHDQGEKRFKCDVCDKLFPAKTSLKKHQFVHLSDEQRRQLKAENTCTECGLGFLNYSILTYHIRQRHEGKYSCVCDICAKSFKTKQNFLAHYQNHHIASGASKKQCNICGTWLSDTGSLRRHIKNMHQNKGPHVCTVCGKETPTMNALKAHMGYVHNDERKYACTICDKAFKRPIGLKEHMTIHIGGALYSCTFCTKTFNSSANLYSHRKKVHLEEYEATKNKKKTTLE